MVHGEDFLLHRADKALRKSRTLMMSKYDDIRVQLPCLQNDLFRRNPSAR